MKVRIILAFSIAAIAALLGASMASAALSATQSITVTTHNKRCNMVVTGAPTSNGRRFREQPVTNTCNDRDRALSWCQPRSGSGVREAGPWVSGYSSSTTPDCPINMTMVEGGVQYPYNDRHTYCLWGCNSTRAAVTTTAHGRISYGTSSLCYTSNGVGNSPSMQPCSSGFNALQEWVLTGTLCRWDTNNCISLAGNGVPTLMTGQGTIGFSYNTGNTITGPISSGTGYLATNGQNGDVPNFDAPGGAGETPWYYFTTGSHISTTAAVFPAVSRRSCSTFDWNVFYAANPNWGEVRWSGTSGCNDPEIRAHIKGQSGSTFKDFNGAWQIGTNWSTDVLPSGTPRWYEDCLAGQWRHIAAGSPISTRWVWPTAGSCQVNKARRAALRDIRRHYRSGIGFTGPVSSDVMTPALRTITQKSVVAGDREFLHRTTCSACASSFSGYIVDTLPSGTTANLSVAEFNVPQLHCSQSTYGTSGVDGVYMWSGIGAGSSVEQDGIQGQCTQGGSPVYSSWYVICCGGDAVHVNPIQLNIQAGDTLTAIVCAPSKHCGDSVSGFFFEISDDTNHNSWTAVEGCNLTQGCDISTDETIMELANTGESTIGTQWDLPKYTWTGTNGNLSSIVGTTSGSGVYSPPPTGVLAWYDMQDQTGNPMTTRGSITNGDQWTWTYVSPN